MTHGMDNGVEIDCGRGLGWTEEGKGGKIGTTVIEYQLKKCFLKFPLWITKAQCYWETLRAYAEHTSPALAR